MVGIDVVLIARKEHSSLFNTKKTIISQKLSSHYSTAESQFLKLLKKKFQPRFNWILMFCPLEWNGEKRKKLSLLCHSNIGKKSSRTNEKYRKRRKKNWSSHFGAKIVISLLHADEWKIFILEETWINSQTSLTTRCLFLWEKIPNDNFDSLA